MAIFQSALFNGPGREKLEDCKAQDSKHIFKGGTPGPHIARIQEALRKLGFTVTDPPGVFGQSTSDAVFKFKGPPRNILQPGQREPDRFVGKRTVTQLDAEVAALEGKKIAPATEVGSNNWRFTFFGNKGFIGKGIYTLFISSTETPDASNFDVNVQFEGGNLLAGFKGSGGGTFKTTAKIPVRRFSSARCEVNLFKLLGRDTMQGFARLQLIGDDDLTALLPIPELKDETFGTTINNGTVIMIGFLRK